MKQNNKENITFTLKIIIPIIVVIGLLAGGVSVGIITFEPPEKKFSGNDVTATITIDFGDELSVSHIITLKNATVYDFLLEVAETEDYTIESTYWEQFGSYVVDSITYQGTKYEADSNHYWAYYLNGQPGMEAADKAIVQNNDLIEWKFEGF